MGLETEVSLLTASVNELVGAYQGKIDGIDAAVSGALSTPNMIRKCFVDAINGDDTADGLTAETAKKTMVSAVATVPDGLTAYIYLLTDAALENVDILNRDLVLWGWDPVNGRTERKLSVVDNGSGVFPAIYSDKGGRKMYLNSLHFELPADTVFPTITGFRQFFILFGGTIMRIADCRMTNPSANTKTLLINTETIMFGVTSFSMDSNSSGLLFNEVPALSDPNLRGGINSELISA